MYIRNVTPRPVPAPPGFPRDIIIRPGEPLPTAPIYVINRVPPTDTVIRRTTPSPQIIPPEPRRGRGLRGLGDNYCNIDPATGQRVCYSPVVDGSAASTSQPDLWTRLQQLRATATLAQQQADARAQTVVTSTNKLQEFIDSLKSNPTLQNALNWAQSQSLISGVPNWALVGGGILGIYVATKKRY